MLFLLKKRSKGSTYADVHFLARGTRWCRRFAAESSNNYDRRRLTMVRSECVGESFIASAPRLPPAIY